MNIITCFPSSGGGKVVPAQPPEEGPARRADENKVDGVSVPKGQSGNSGRGPGDGGNKDHWKESDRKDGKKDQDSRSAPEPKKPEENPASMKDGGGTSVRAHGPLSHSPQLLSSGKC